MNKVCIYLYCLPVRVTFKLPLSPFKTICVYFWGKYIQDTYKMQSSLNNFLHFWLSLIVLR